MDCEDLGKESRKRIAIPTSKTIGSSIGILLKFHKYRNIFLKQY